MIVVQIVQDGDVREAINAKNLELMTVFNMRQAVEHVHDALIAAEDGDVLVVRYMSGAKQANQTFLDPAIA